MRDETVPSRERAERGPRDFIQGRDPGADVKARPGQARSRAPSRGGARAWRRHRGAGMLRGMEPRIRSLAPDEDFEALTDLVHRAYGPLAAAGMRYWASHQSVEDTRERCARGETWLAEVGGTDGPDGAPGRVVGCVVLCPPGTRTDHAFYARPGVATFQQLCVHPDAQGRGVGRALMRQVEERSRALGATELALDTSEHAHELIRTYERRGFRRVATADWRPHVNYRSVVLSLRLEP